MLYTSRLAIPNPQDADVPDFPEHFAARAAILDKAAITDHGPLSNRPVSTPASPGIKGRRFYAEDTAEEFLDTGTGWVRLQVGTGVKADALSPLSNSFNLRISGGSTATGGPTAGRTELWDRISVSGSHGFGTFPDPGAGCIYAAGRVSAQAPAAALDDTGNTTNRMGSAKNVVSLAVGTQESTAAYAATDYSATIRMGGAGVAYGDISYYPMAADGHFKLARSPGGVSQSALAGLRLARLHADSVQGYATVAGVPGLEVLGRLRADNGLMSSSYIWSRDGTENSVIIGYDGANAAPTIRFGFTTPLLATAGVENLRVIRGTINADGTIARGTGFTVTKGTTGYYTINFSTAFKTVPDVVATTVGLGWVASRDTLAVGRARVMLMDVPSLAMINAEFSFIAIGPR